MEKYIVSLQAQLRVACHVAFVNTACSYMDREQGYSAYTAILFTMAGLLAAALGLCVWIAFQYKNRSFAYTWWVAVLRQRGKGEMACHERECV
jgi:hypothetical protein